MLRTLVAIILIAIGGLSNASAAMTCENVFDSQYRISASKLKEIQKKLEELDQKKAPGTFDYLIDKSIQATIEYFNLRGIKWRYSTKSKRVLIIEPDSSGSVFNQIAAGLSKNLSGLSLEVNPRDLHNMEAVFYDDTKNRIVVDAGILLGQGMNPTLYHEIRHALNQQKFYKGEFQTFSGEINLYSKKINLNSTYEKDFSLDEVVTYAVEVYHWIRMWKNMPSDASTAFRSELIHRIQVAKSISGWVRRVTARSETTLGELLEDASGWKGEENYLNYEGQVVPQKQLVKKKDRKMELNVYQIIPDKSGNLDHATTMVGIRHGQIGATFAFAGKQETLHLRQWVEKARARAQEIQKRIQAIDDGWSDLLVATRLQDTETALQIVEDIRRQALSETSGL